MAGRRGRGLRGGWRDSARGPVGQVFLLVGVLRGRRPPSFNSGRRLRTEVKGLQVSRCTK